jgi:hypothetical protein
MQLREGLAWSLVGLISLALFDAELRHGHCAAESRHAEAAAERSAQERLDNLRDFINASEKVGKDSIHCEILHGLLGTLMLAVVTKNLLTGH